MCTLMTWIQLADAETSSLPMLNAFEGTNFNVLAEGFVYDHLDETTQN